MATISQSVTTVPVELTSLQSGTDYTFQNLSNKEVLAVEAPSGAGYTDGDALTFVSITAYGSVLSVWRGSASSGNSIYLWVRDGEATVGITEVE